MLTSLRWRAAVCQCYGPTYSGYGVTLKYILLFYRHSVFSLKLLVHSHVNVYSVTDAMVYSMVAISLLSFVVWVHHFFTMGAGPAVNSFFSISTMAISIPTGVKIFNWLFTLYKGRIRFTVPMLWSLAFIPNFVVGGVTGVMLGMAAADYQYHNSYFLVAHFHYVLIAGTVFAMLAGFILLVSKNDRSYVK